MLLGPVFWMEMRTGARRARHYFTRAFLVSVIFAVLICSWLSFHNHRTMFTGTAYSSVAWLSPLLPHELPKLGRELFSAYSITLLLVVLFLAPLYTAGSVAADRERRVLELLFVTNLRNVELVASKFLVRTLQLCALVAGAAPVMFVCLLLGGVSAEAILATLAITLACAMFVASLGLLISIGSRRAYGAIVVTYLVLLIAWLAVPFLAGTLLFTTGAAAPTGSWADIGMMTLTLNPLFALMTAVLENGPPWMQPEAPWICAAVYSGVAALLLLLDVFVIRRLGLWASRERIVRDRKKDRARRTRRVWNNPVAWREVKTIAVHRRMRWARLLTLLFSFLFSAILWVGWVADWLDGRAALDMDADQVSSAIACTVTVAWMLMVLQACVSFSHERELSTLDALLTTPLAGIQIVVGKLQGVLRSSAFALAFPIGFALLAWTHGVVTFRAAALTIALTFLVGLFAAAVGLACSVRLGSSGKACGLGAGIMLTLCVGLPIASETFLPHRSRTPWFGVRFLSPSDSISWAIYDEQRIPRVESRMRHQPDYRRWPARLAATAVHLLLEQLVAIGLVAWSVSHIERRFRVRQWLTWRGAQGTYAPSAGPEIVY